MTLSSPWIAGGQWVRGLRRKSEITMAELAEQVGAPGEAWIEQLEAGMRPVPSSMYRTFAETLNQPVAEFARTCLKHYDPKAHEALFPEAAGTRDARTGARAA